MLASTDKVGPEMGQISALTSTPDEEEAEFEAFRPKVKGTNIDEQTLLATDYLNHFNEVVMLFDMLPDMPELIEDCRAWQPKSYEDHFRQSTFSDRDLAVEAYGKVPSRFRVPFEETIRQINELILSSTDRLEQEINAGSDPEVLRHIGGSVSRAAQVLMDHASAIIHGSSQTMDQDEIDTMIGK
jgi:hypothetical protein